MYKKPELLLTWPYCFSLQNVNAKFPSTPLKNLKVAQKLMYTQFVWCNCELTVNPADKH